MSDRIDEILEVLGEVAAHYRAEMSETQVRRLRIEALQRISGLRGIEATTVSDKFRRQLRPRIAGTAEFDAALFDWLDSGSQGLRMALEENAGLSDLMRIRAFFEAASADVNVPRIVARAAAFRGAGESERHRRLKEHVASHPGLFGLPERLKGDMEYPLPSGDSLDVFFEHEGRQLGIEVKSTLSSEADLARGLFQCVKYQAVLQARQQARRQSASARALLLLEGALPTGLAEIRRRLAIEVIEGIQPS